MVCLLRDPDIDSDTSCGDMQKEVTETTLSECNNESSVVPNERSKMVGAMVNTTLPAASAWLMRDGFISAAFYFQNGNSGNWVSAAQENLQIMFSENIFGNMYNIIFQKHIFLKHIHWWHIEPVIHLWS